MVYCLADQLPGLTGVWAEAEVAYLLEERHNVDWFELLAPQAQASWFLRLQMLDGSAHQVEIRDRSPDGVRETPRPRPVYLGSHGRRSTSGRSAWRSPWARFRFM